MVQLPGAHSHVITIFGNQTYPQPPTLAEGLFTAIEVRSQPPGVTVITNRLGTLTVVRGIATATTPSAEVIA